MSEDNSEHSEGKVKRRENRKSTGSIHKILSDLNSIEKKRNSDIQEIQHMVEKCKERVEVLKNCLSEDELQDGPTWQSSPTSGSLSSEDDCTCTLFSKENLIMAGGVGMLLFVLRSNMCSNLLPRYPSFYGCIYKFIMQLHLQYATFLPLMTELALKRWLKKETFHRIEFLLMQWKYKLGIAMSIAELVTLLIKKCYLKSYAFFIIFTIQVATIVATFLLELRALCYLTPKSALVRMPSQLSLTCFHMDFKDGWNISETQLINYVTIFFLALNTTLSP